MNFLDKLERRLGNLAIPHLTEILIFGQAVVWLAATAGWLTLQNIVLVPGLVQSGEWRRLLTFLLIPPSMNPIWLLVGLMFFYFIGKALETQWGEFRYTLFIFAGYAATVASSFLFPRYPVTNMFIGTSIFLAFAILYPEMEVQLFFILPVKMKWLAAFSCVIYVWQILTGTWPIRVQILASLFNLALFFGADFVRLLQRGGRQAVLSTKEAVIEIAPFHVCVVCGKTDRTHPQENFRYCSQCGGSKGYCSEHIRAHAHE